MIATLQTLRHPRAWRTGGRCDWQRFLVAQARISDLQSMPPSESGANEGQAAAPRRWPCNAEIREGRAKSLPSRPNEQDKEMHKRLPDPDYR